MNSLINSLRTRPGHLSAFGLTSGLIIYTYNKGPSLESNLSKYILAGTTATVAVELGSHYIDTINMRSKIIKSQQSFYQGSGGSKLKGYLSMSNMKGYQMVVHGYFLSCIVFFFVQFQSKLFTSDLINKNTQKSNIILNESDRAKGDPFEKNRQQLQN